MDYLKTKRGNFKIEKEFNSSQEANECGNC